MTKITLCLLTLALAILSAGAKQPKDTVRILTKAEKEAKWIKDSTRFRIYSMKEVDFIVNHIDSSYICGRRRLTEQQWQDNINVIRNKVADCNPRDASYYYALRYVGLLLNDAHFAFPDGGNYNRSRYFKDEDMLFPIWVKTWKDGSVYCVNDYEGKIPEHAQIISVNGHSAQSMALLNRKLYNAEDLNAMSMMNLDREPSVFIWQNFRNHMFMEGIKPPYKVAYSLLNSTKIDTITLQGITRQEQHKLYKKSGGKKRALKAQGKRTKIVSYKKMNDDVGVLQINSFWGRNFVELLVLGVDWTFSSQLNSSMRKAMRHNPPNFIIDLRLNPGGMTTNINKTLAYLTDKPIDMAELIRVTDANRFITKMVLGNGLKDLKVPKTDIERLQNLVDSVDSGTVLETDSLFSLKIKPKTQKNKFTGNVYVLTSNYTYSAAQEFVQHFKLLGLGETAGEPCGGYYIITTGNADPIRLPYYSGWLRFMIPRGVNKTFYENGTYDYMPVDIPIEREFNEWLHGNDGSLNRLIEEIRTKHN